MPAALFFHSLASVSTHQLISTILANPLEHEADGPSIHENTLRSGATLIVVPALQIEQWTQVRPQSILVMLGNFSFLLKNIQDRDGCGAKSTAIPACLC